MAPAKDVTTPMAAPADAPSGPNMEPAFAPFIAELTVSIATLKPSAIPPNTPPNESPSFENVSERNCPVCIISLMPSSISAKPSFNFLASLSEIKTFFRPFETLLKEVSIWSASWRTLAISSLMAFNWSGDLRSTSNCSLVIPNELSEEYSPLSRKDKNFSASSAMARIEVIFFLLISSNSRVMMEVLFWASLSTSASSFFIPSARESRSPSVVALAIFSL